MEFRVNRKVLLIGILLMSLKVNAQLKIDTINADHNKLKLDRLKESAVNYLVYFTDSTKLQRRSVGDIWERKLKKVRLNDEDVIEFSWRIIADKAIVKQTKDILNAKTFAPINYFSITNFRGKTDTTAYIFENGYLRKNQSVSGNSVKDDFEKKLDIPVLNWELDIETYPLLPIKRTGQTFDIAFFDVNEEAPNYHRYQVIGEDNLNIFDDFKLPCWLLQVVYDENDSAIFWLSKKTGELIKSEEKVKIRNTVMYSIKERQF